MTNIPADELTSTFDNVVRILSPSWLSGLVAITIGLAISVGVVLSFYFTNTGLQQQLVVLEQTSSQPTLSTPGDPQIILKSSLQQNIPILVLYAFVGLAIYYIAVSIVGFFQELAELKQELQYVNARPKQLVSSFIERLVTRLITLVVWLGFTEFFFQRIIPYSITAAHASAANIWTVAGIEYVVVSFGLVALTMQLHATFIRIIVGRTRTFST